MSMLTRRYNAAAAGFSLIELMVTVAIVAILATIAQSTYQSSVMKSRRTEARNAILDMAGREEKLFSTTNAYSQNASDIGYSGAGSTVTLTYYTVTVSAPAPTAGTLPTYTITATPIAPQTRDTTCTSLIVDQTGNQTATPLANAATCWGR
jgi:type IV pilus assembly protein PilE